MRRCDMPFRLGSLDGREPEPDAANDEDAGSEADADAPKAATELIAVLALRLPDARDARGPDVASSGSSSLGSRGREAREPERYQEGEAARLDNGASSSSWAAAAESCRLAGGWEDAADEWRSSRLMDTEEMKGGRWLLPRALLSDG